MILDLDGDTKPDSVPDDVVNAVSVLLRSRSTTLRISEDGKCLHLYSWFLYCFIWY
jgi:hypothetical protein